uniref:Protein-tyrosine phosphatase n=1 Tax=Steinernema glaseri TaxID=37863 RepID=A0A1I7YNQ3_9BILA
MSKGTGSRRRRSGTSVMNTAKKRSDRTSSAGKKKDADDVDVDKTVDDTSERRKKKQPSKKPSKLQKSSGLLMAKGSAADVMGKKIDSAAEEAFAAFVTKTLATGVEGLRREFAEVKMYVPSNCEHSAFTANEARNRYTDIICLDATRVPLTLNVPPEPDYINANWVRMEGGGTFIATQGPLEQTIPDFWRMVHQESVSTILMACLTEEDGKPKCAQYWPLESGAYQTYGSMFVNNKKIEKEERVTIFTLEVLPEGCSNSTITKLVQITNWWPDRSVPQSGNGLLRMLKLVSQNSPTIVHCSAGVGRTGTMIAVHTVIERLLKGQQVNVRDVITQLRNQRAHAVQTEGQYVYIHVCALYYISAKIRKYAEMILPFHNEYIAAKLN